MSNLWTEQRQRLMKQLQNYSPDLAEIYRMAIDLLDSTSGMIDAARMSVISHCMRELMNAIFDFVIPDSKLPSRSQLFSERKDDWKVLDAQWKEYEDQHASNKDASGQTVPPELICALENFYQGNRKREEVNNQKRSLLVLNDLQDSHPAVVAWKHAHGFFQSKTHFSIGRKPEKCGKVIKYIEIFEICMSARLGLFFNAALGIKAIALQANSKDAGHYIKPSKESVDAALAGLVSYEHRQLFFRILKNPHWVSALLEKGYFVQAAQSTEPQLSYWPELGYLRQMAAEEPDCVMRAINEVIKLRIPARTMNCIECLSSLPIKGTKYIEREFIDQLCEGDFQNLTTDALESLCIHVNHLLKGSNKAQKRGSRLFYTLFEARINPKEPVQSKKVAESLVPYFYLKEQLVVTLSGVPLPRRMLLLQKLVINYNNVICKSVTSHIPSVFESYFIRPEIAHAEPYMQYDYGNTLIDYIRDVLNDECADNDDVLRKAWDSNDLLVRRIVLYVVSTYLERCLSSNSSIAVSYMGFVQGLIDNASSLVDDYDSELIPLIRACCSLRNEIDLSRFFGLIEAYRQREYEKLLLAEERFTEFHALDKDYISKFADQKEYRLLALIGEDNLPKKLTNRLQNYRRCLGEIAFSPRVGPIMTVGHSYSSPLDVGEIASMTHQELLSFLQEWDSDDNDLEKPSKYGLAIELEESAADFPTISEDLLHKLGESCSVYATRLLSGLGKALEKGKSIPIHEILVYTKRQLNNPLNHSLLMQCVQLLMRASSQVVNEDSLALECIELLDCCCNVAGVKKEEDERLADLREAKRAALDSLRPTALRALAAMAAEDCTDIVKEHALTAFYRIAKSDTSIVLGAAIGLSIFYVLRADWDMAVENRESLFGQIADSDMQKCACATAFDCYNYSFRLLQFFYPAVLDALSEHREIDASKDFDYILPLGRYLLHGYISRHVFYDDQLFQKWFEVAGSSNRKSVLRHACRLAGGEEKSLEAVEMVMEYWDLRATVIGEGNRFEEMTGVFLLAHNTAIEMEWLLPRMKMEAEYNPNPEDAALVMKRLAEASDGHEEEVLTILMLLYDASTKTNYLFRHDLTIAAVPTLARVLKSGNQDLKEKALCFMDLLGSLGYIEIDRKVREFNG